MDTKPWYLSKTIWVNVLTLIATCGAQLADVLPVSMSQYVVTGLAIVNVLLRTITTQAVTK